MGRRPDQQHLFSADNQYLDLVGDDNFYGFLALHGQKLFCDDGFEELYCPDFGRPSVGPSLLAIALLLQAHDKVSDAEATQRAAFDMGWKVALGVELEERSFAKSTLQLFRAQLVIHDEGQGLLVRSLKFARQVGYLKGRKARVVVDSTDIWGRGAVEDTCNLIAHGIVKVCRVLSEVEGQASESWSDERSLGR